MGRSLLDKVWDLHTVGELSGGQTQLFVGLHLIHEVTSPQAFAALDQQKLCVRFPERTFATADHIVPTDSSARPLQDALAEAMLARLEQNCRAHAIQFFDHASGRQGIVHVIGPELGLSQPGITIACGDSHTSTHGAFGAIAFGIGTSQVRDVLASQCMAVRRPRVRRIEVSGALSAGVYAKDVILSIIRRLGVKGGIGFAYEYGGDVIDAMSMEERLTVCNMSVEGGARVGYVNPDEKTFEYLKDRNYSPKGGDWDAAVEEWTAIASDPDCAYDDVVNIKAEDIAPSVTWGISPDHGIFVNENIPSAADVDDEEEKASIEEALEYMKFEGGSPIAGTPVDVCFIGSCTNGRLSDFREAAKFLKGHKVAESVQAIAVPGSEIVDHLCRQEGLHTIFEEAGFEWRGAGCSMCLAMNPDKLVGDQLCASSSNRNFKGRQGSPTGRTILMSPVMVAAAAVKGAVADAREVFQVGETAAA